MVVVAQLVRASDCGSEGRGFEPRLPPSTKPCISWRNAGFLRDSTALLPSPSVVPNSDKNAIFCPIESEVGGNSGGSFPFVPVACIFIVLNANGLMFGNDTTAPATSNNVGSVLTFIVKSIRECLIAACAVRGDTPALLTSFRKSFAMHEHPMFALECLSSRFQRFRDLGQESL